LYSAENCEEITCWPADGVVPDTDDVKNVHDSDG
jgi:hypothetical protein